MTGLIIPDKFRAAAHAVKTQRRCANQARLDLDAGIGVFPRGASEEARAPEEGQRIAPLTGIDQPTLTLAGGRVQPVPPFPRPEPDEVDVGRKVVS